MNAYKNENPDWEQIAVLIAEKLKVIEKPERRFLKSAEARKLLGGISAAKLQSLRVGRHLPAINADGLWLYDLEDIMSFLNKNRIGGEEASRR